MKIYLALGLLIAFATHPVFANNSTEKLPQSSPVPGVQIGKVTVTSIHKLTPTVKKMVEADLAEQPFGANRKLGEISDDAIIYRKNYYAQLKPLRDVEKNLTFKLADISRGELGKYTLEGVIPEGPSQKGPWSSVTRIFKRDDNVVVMLHEWNYVGDGGGVMIIEELMNTKVNNSPARFSVKRSPAGWLSSELMWVTNKSMYTLTVMDDVPDSSKAKYNVKWLTSVAASIKEHLKQ